MYDYASLSERLSEIGFRQIERRSYQAGRAPDLSILDNRPDDSLYVEATR
jgi:hypothetical protein